MWNLRNSSSPETFQSQEKIPQPSRYVFHVLKAAKTMDSTGKSKADIQNFACCEPCTWDIYATTSRVHKWKEV